MTNHNFTCPHCDGQIKVIPQKSAPNRKTKTFESVTVTNDNSNGFWRGVWSTLRGYDYVRPSRIRNQERNDSLKNHTLTIETINTVGKTMTIAELDERIKIDDLHKVAIFCVTKKYDWTRSNLRRHTGLRINKIRIIQEEFKRLGYLTVSENNRSSLTSRGRLTLRGILSMFDPPTHDDPI